MLKSKFCVPNLVSCMISTDLCFGCVFYIIRIGGTLPGSAAPGYLNSYTMYTVIALFLLLVFLMAGPRLHAGMIPGGAYVTRERTCMINGFFIWVVFISHLSGYKVDVWTGDTFVLSLVRQLGQCCVATFFFYSGYGMMAQLCRGGYCKRLIINRLPFLLLCMVMAVTMFLLVQTFYGVGFPVSRILLSFIGWSSLGNSNWFIFVTLVSYILIAISYTLFYKQGMQLVAWYAAVLFVGLVVVLRLAGKELHWYNTCLCIPAGMFFFLWREKIEGIIRWGRIPAWCLGMVLIPVSLLMYHLLLRQAYLTNFPAILFALGVTLLFSCISLKRSPAFSVLEWGCWIILPVYFPAHSHDDRCPGRVECRFPVFLPTLLRRCYPGYCMVHQPGVSVVDSLCDTF